MNYGTELEERTMHKIVKVEEVLYESGHASHPMIGFNLYYDDDVIYPLPPILLRQELDALLADAYDRGLVDGRKAYIKTASGDFQYSDFEKPEVTE